MKDWALEKGATHYTHWFQPLTGSTAEKHDSFFGPVGDGTALAQFTGKELIRGEPDASSFPSGGIRATFEARGYTAWDPTSPAFIIENPNGAYLCIPTAFASWTGEALDTKIPLLRSMSRPQQVGPARAAPVRRHRHDARLHDDRPGAGVLPDRRAVLLPAPRPGRDRPHPVRRQAGQGPAARRPLLRVDPGAGARLHARDRAASWPSSACRSRPATTRSRRRQYEIAPIFENSNVGTDHQQLCMQVMQNVARRYGMVCLLHEKPFAGVNGSGKHNNWSMSTDDAQPARPGRHAARQPAVPVLRDGRHLGRSTSTRACCARRSRAPARTTASAPTRPRRRSSRSSSARSSRTSSPRSPRASRP